MSPIRGLTAIGTFLAFFLVLFGLGVLWVATGGPTRPISHSGPFLSGPQVPGVELNNEGTLPNQPIQNPTARSERGDSPYASGVSVRLGDVIDANPAAEYLLLDISPHSESYTLTGWTLASKASGKSVTLGAASTLPSMGSLSGSGPVTVTTRSRIFVISGRSPIGVSFRENKCTGYFAQFQTFIPELENNCPFPYDEAVQTIKNDMTAECTNLVTTLPGCEIYSEQVPASVGGACQNFVSNTLTYNGCVAMHRNDADFYSNSWYVYLSSDQKIWGGHDTITLTDENGKIISTVVY